jgi:WD40 repeat protein
MFIATSLESIQQTLRYVFFSNDLQNDTRIFEAYIPPFVKQHLQDEKEVPFNVIECTRTFLKDPHKQSLLVLGDSGMGKTLFSQCLAKQMWEEVLASKAETIPIYIHLPAIANRQGELEKGLLEKYLKEKSGLEKRDILYLKTQKIPLLLTLDGIDEVRWPGNLYSRNDWEQWNLKLIYTCRPEALLSYQNYQQYFYSSHGNLPVSALLSEVRLCPFNGTQVRQYVARKLETLLPEERESLNKIDPKWLVPEAYMQAIDTLPGLQELVETPFMLNMLVQVLPMLPEDPTKKHLTRVKLYQRFTQNWFERQARRLQKEGQLPSFKGELASYLLHYAKNLALDKLVQGKLETLIDEQDTLAHYLLKPKDPELLQSFKLDQNLLETHIEAVRSGCLLKTQGKQFRFLHKSLLEYLVEEELLIGALGLVQTDTHRLMGKQGKAGYAFQEQLLVDKPEIIVGLAELAQSNPAFKDALWQLIMLSKEDAYYSIAAANAITVWNRAGFSLINVDLRNTHLVGADLRHATLIGSWLDGADLRDVRLDRANLSLASLQGACLTGIQLGQKPMLEHPGIFALEPEYALSKNRIAVADGCYVYIYQIDIGKLLARLTNWSFWRTGWDSPEIRDVVWQPQGQQLAVGSSDGYIRLWDMQGYTCTWALEAYESPIGYCQLGYHPEGLQLVSLAANWKYWNAASGAIEKMLPESRGISYFKYSPDGKQLATNGKSLHSKHCITLLHAQSGKEEGVLEGHGWTVCCIVFYYSPDGKHKQLASGGKGGEIILWDVISGKKEKVLTWHTKSVLALAYRADGQQLASGSEDKTIVLWDVVRGKMEKVLQTSSPVRSLGYYQGGQCLASGGQEGIHLWQLVGGDEQAERAAFSGVELLSYRPDGLQFASRQNHTTYLRETASGKLERKLVQGKTNLICYSPSGQQVALSQLGSYTITLWDVKNGEQQGALGLPAIKIPEIDWGKQSSASFMAYVTSPILLKAASSVLGPYSLSYRPPDGLQLASGNYGDIHLWDIVNAKVERILSVGDETVYCIQYSPDGSQLASMDGSTICLWDMKTGKRQGRWKSGQRVCQFIGFRSSAFLSYQPGGQQLASAGSHTICLWEMKNYRCLQVLKHEEEITCVSYSLDGTYLASGDSSNHIYLWSPSLGNCLRKFTIVNFLPLALQFTQQETLQVGYENNVSLNLKFTWQDEVKQVKLKLQHISNKTSPKLTCVGTQLKNSFGLSEANLKLLQQQGATGHPSKEKHWSSVTSSTLFQAARPTKQAVRNIVGNQVILDEKSGAVSLVRSKDGNHAFFLIEVATTRGIKIYIADLTTPDGLLLQSVGRAKVKIRLELWRDDLLYNKLKEKVRDDLIYRTFEVKLDKLNQLYTSIEQDKYKEIYYAMSGNSGFFSIGDKTYENCMTWCLDKLEEIGIELPKQWLPSPKLYLPEIKIEEAQEEVSSCLYKC